MTRTGLAITRDVTHDEHKVCLRACARVRVCTRGWQAADREPFRLRLKNGVYQVSVRVCMRAC